MGLQIDWFNQVIEITSPTVKVDMQTAADFIEDQMATPRGMTESDIILPEGKIPDPSNPGIFSQIIILLNSPWQFQFWGGSGYSTIFGGKLVGGLSDEPVKATGTAGDITVLNSPVDGVTSVVETGTSGLTTEESDALLQNTADLSAMASSVSTIDGNIATINTDIGLIKIDITSLETDVAFMKAIEAGEWHIVSNQMIFYDDLAQEIARFDLKNASGDPAMTDVYRRIPV
jgi:hypothetical protein